MVAWREVSACRLVAKSRNGRLASRQRGTRLTLTLTLTPALTLTLTLTSHLSPLTLTLTRSFTSTLAGGLASRRMHMTCTPRGLSPSSN